MTARSIRIPDAAHPIAVTRNPSRVVVTVAGRVIADSRDVLTLREANYPPVQYVPRADVDLTQVTATDHTSYCPYKGQASYYSIAAGGKSAVNAIWSYEEPHDAMAAIKDYMAFYPDRVDKIEIG